MRKAAATLLTILVLVLCAPGKQKQDGERIRVYLHGGHCDVPTGAVVESSLRDSIRSSSGYALADEEEAGAFLISLACVNVGEGWAAVGYHYGLIVGAKPEKLGNALWNPTLGVFSVGPDGARRKAQELFAKFDNEVHRQ
jgi:hypothetical protein